MFFLLVVERHHVAEFEHPPPTILGVNYRLPHHLILKKISENPEFCCESKENEKSKKKSKNIKPWEDGVTTRVRLFFKDPKM